ncbi:MAG: diguanylate cyclase domain-containing protein [Gemmatimonadaceae bacterium]
MVATDVSASNRPNPAVLNQLSTVRILVLAVASLTAATVLGGWLVPGFGSVLPHGWNLMKANTAVAVLLCAASSLSGRRKRGRAWMLAGRACAMLAVALAVAALIEHSTGRTTGVSTLLAADASSPAPGRMSIQSAACFVLLGLSLVIDPTQRGVLGALMDVDHVLLVVLTTVLIAGYAFGAPNLFGQSSATLTSLQSLLCIALLTFVQVSGRAPYGFFSVLVGVGIGSQAARFMLPVFVVLSFVIVLVGERLLATGMLSLAYAASVTASAMATLLLMLVVLLARQINALEAQLRERSLSDELTGCHNRRGFALLGEQALREAKRAGKPLTVMFFDVDGLKKVNDALGHDAGSKLLLDVANLLRENFRESDIVGRMGGDEFAVIAMNREDEMAGVLHRLQRAIEIVNAEGARPYQVSVSKGVAMADPESDEPLDAVLSRADAMMYEAKRQRGVSRQ